MIGITERLNLAGRLLQGHNGNLNDRKQLVAYAHEGMADLLRYLKLDGMFQKNLSPEKLAYERLLSNSGKLLTLVEEWMELKISDPQLNASAYECGAMLISIAQCIKDKKEQELLFRKISLISFAGNFVSERKAFLVLATIIELLEAMPALLDSRTAHIPNEKATTPSKKLYKQIFLQDAFSNPDYIQYSLKTTLAIFLAYLCYNLLDWPGIRTSMITCFFVSLGTFGETAHKMTLRLAGAIIGGGLGLSTIIFIMPYLTTITGLSLLIAIIVFFAGWVSTSSERLSYMGYQIALAFFLSVLVGYGPTIDLTQPRDRVVGILLGNLIIAVVFALIWPTSAIDRARVSLAAALDKLSKIFSKGFLSVREGQDQWNALVFAYSNAILQAKHLFSLHIFELDIVQPGTIKVNIGLIEGVQALRGPVILLAEGPLFMPVQALSNKELTAYYQLLSVWLDHVSVQVKENKPRDIAGAQYRPTYTKS